MCGLHDYKEGWRGPSAELGGAGTPHWGRAQEAVCRLLVLLLFDPVGTLPARLLVDVVGVEIS